MLKLGLFVKLHAKPEKVAELEAFLAQGLSLANAEETTPVWYALRFDECTFGIFDAFADTSGRNAHLEGPIAAALMANAETLLSAPPIIERLEVLGAKNAL